MICFTNQAVSLAAMNLQTNVTAILHMTLSLLLLTACTQHLQTTASTAKKVVNHPIVTLPVNPPQKRIRNNTKNVFLQGLPPQDIARAQASVKKHLLPHWHRITTRSTLVRQRLVNTLEEMHAPLSLQVIPAIESGYQPYALSRTGAMGLWQLMPQTARSLGIEHNPYLDGRRHIETSTHAAVTYLQKQYQRFGNWPLAFAAYNMGPNGLAKRLKKQPWTLQDGLDNMPVPQETKNYVRHIIGLTALLEMHIIAFPPALETKAITLHAPVDLKQLAKSSHLSDSLLFQLNPGLQYSQYLQHDITIHAPIKSLPLLQKQQHSHRPKYIKVQVQAGDSLWKLARQHHSSVSQLRKLNPKLPHTLRVGSYITVPAHTFSRAVATNNPLLSQGRRIHYKVHKGDSLWSISRKFGTSPHAIARANQLSKHAIIRPGDRLWILARI